MTEVVSFEKRIVVAKEMWDNLPFTNKEFEADSVNGIAEYLSKLVEAKRLSPVWINKVYDASLANQPIHIDLMEDWNWFFVTAKHGTKDDLLTALGKIGKKGLAERVKRGR